MTTVRDWEGSAFDPANLRVFSLLPEADAEDAHCVRHDREMKAIDPLVHTDGALYTTADGFSVYTCTRCVDTLNARGAREGNPCAGVKIYRRRLHKAFSRWDAGNAPADWFKYVGESTVDEPVGNARLISFIDWGAD